MLTVNHLELQREGRVVHSPLSFALQKGEALWLKGPNGTGKSTLLKAILGWLPHAGVTLGSDVTLAYLGHQTGLPTHLTVWEHCEHHPAIAEFNAAQCEDVLRAFSLYDCRHRRVGVLSAGQKQRLALACVILSGASLWLLDEPFTALDAGSTIHIKAILKSHLSKGVGMLVVSHDDLSDWATHTIEMRGA